MCLIFMEFAAENKSSMLIINIFFGIDELVESKSMTKELGNP